MKTEKYDVTGMTCAACQANVERCVRKLDGVQSVEVSLLANQMTVSYDENKVGEKTICDAVEKIGYVASVPKAPAKEDDGDSFRKSWQARRTAAEEERESMKRRLIASVVLLVPLMYVAMGHMLHLPVPGFLLGTQNALIFAFTQLLLALPCRYCLSTDIFMIPA